MPSICYDPYNMTYSNIDILVRASLTMVYSLSKEDFLAILLIISLGICGVLAVRAHMRRKKLLKKILQLQFNKTIAEVGLALIAPIQG